MALFSISVSNAQQVIINGLEGNRPLVWSDFKGKPDPASVYYALTGFNVGYNMPQMKVTRDSVPLDGFVVRLELDAKKSWVKKGKQTPALLKHEQGHFDIGRLAQMELVDILKGTKVLPSQLSATVGKIFNTTLAKYNRMGIQYDAETNHSIKQAEQDRWDLFLQNELARMANLR
ncbi:MAG: DUF922 domain-containing protein [Chitinophagaceae bacterium]